MHSFHHSSQPPATPFAISRWRPLGPSFTLVLLAPVISEVLFGSTRLSFIPVLIPEILVFGCGALLIRECVFRWGKGWRSLLLMGLALAIAEECIIQQTSIAPLLGLVRHEYGRIWGVNSVYLLWALGYWSVWVVLIPVQLTSLLFPGRRSNCWLRTRGLVIVSIIFVLGSFIAWYGWTQRARVKIFHMPPYTPSSAALLTGIAAILLLIFAAYVLPVSESREKSPTSRFAPSPWVVRLVCFVLGAPWSAFILVGFGFFLTAPVRLVMVVALSAATLTFFLIRRWTRASNWRDTHRFAIVFGGILACMLGGFVVLRFVGALRVDWIGKIILNAAAIAWLISVGRATKLRAAP